MRLNPFYVLAVCCMSEPGLAQSAPDCASLTQSTNKSTLIVWNAARPRTESRGTEGDVRTVLGPLRAIAIIEDGEIREPRNEVLTEGETLWSVVNAGQEVLLTKIHPWDYLLRPGISYCLFSAEAETSAVEPHALFTNDREFRLRPPTDSEQAEFDEHIYPITYCANRGGMFLRDVAPEDWPPCDAPKLIGLSDIDEDSKPEFWATDILKFATEIAVWEYYPTGYAREFRACPGCAD